MGSGPWWAAPADLAAAPPGVLVGQEVPSRSPCQGQLRSQSCSKSEPAGHLEVSGRLHGACALDTERERQWVLVAPSAQPLLYLLSA